MIYILVCLSGNAIYAAVVTHGSGGAFTVNNGTVSAPNSQYFDRAQFLFATEWADTLTISNIPSAADAHIHALGEILEVDVYDGGSWVNIFSYNGLPTSGLDQSLDTIFTAPIHFTGMHISGLRLDVGGTAAGNNAQMYHRVAGTMTYTTTPEPATLTLVALGGIAAIRRSRKLQHD